MRPKKMKYRLKLFLIEAEGHLGGFCCGLSQFFAELGGTILLDSIARHMSLDDEGTKKGK